MTTTGGLSSKQASKQSTNTRGSAVQRPTYPASEHHSSEESATRQRLTRSWEREQESSEFQVGSTIDQPGGWDSMSSALFGTRLNLDGLRSVT